MLRYPVLRVAAYVLAAALPLAGAHAQATDPEDSRWARTLERVSTGVVTIQVDQTRAFDTEWNTSAQATGFVVDARRGLILTNRHVVTPGPVTAQAVFLDREEVELQPVYRDPVHDFGIYRYDPAALKFMKPAELPLYPQGAQVGREIRVVGNDAGEQLSILAGTLARLDREAPDYGIAKYNDFNTFYYQAASSTSGGSSGSPVIDIEGRVVALNAGGSSGAASSFYLPLDRVTRALELIRAGRPVTRGTLETVFRYTPFGELERLGLDQATEAQVRARFPGGTGMLVVVEVQPGSAAEAVLEPGDILVRAGGELTTTFNPLGELLDSHVGQPVTLEIRRGDKVMSPTLDVEDLHSVTPHEFLEFGDAVVHTLSWQQARHLNTPIKGVYVANPGYVLGAAGIPHGAVIKEVSGHPTPTLAEFEQIVRNLKDGEQFTTRFISIEDPRASQLRSVRMDRKWFPARHCHRDDAAGIWPCEKWPDDGVAAPPAPVSTEFARTGDRRLDRIAASLVLVNFDMPYSVEGITERNYYGTGVVVDAQRGLVVVDRNTVPASVGDVRLTFAGTVEIPARVEYLHPLHNLTVLAYDPALIGSTPVRSAEFDTRELASGEPIRVIGLSPDSKLQSQESRVASIDIANFPLSRTLQFRDSNLETIELVNGPSGYDGVIINGDGRIAALWSSFAYEAGREMNQENRGVPAQLVTQMLPLVKEGRPLNSLEAEFTPVPLASARKLGLDDDWVGKLARHAPQRRQVLGIERLVAGSPAESQLRTGDLVLAVDGQVVNRFAEVEHAVQDKERVHLTLLRDEREVELDLATVPLYGRDIDRIVAWAGAILHEPHRAMAAQRGIPPEGVFIAYFAYGSPATRYQLWAGRRIVEVDGQPTPDLDSFLKTVSGRADRASVRLKTVSWNGATDVTTLKLDEHYWPAYELIRTADGGWQRRALD
jgi:pro-apoptotic serine protease NMA111